MIEVVVNDLPRTLEAPATVRSLLRELRLAERPGIAAAVNGEVVPRAEWDTRGLGDRDRILVIQATQGG